MITVETLDRITRLIGASAVDETTIVGLRERFPGVHFTACSDEDVGAARPVREHAGFNLYLVDGRGHCLGFTSDPEAATGLVVAWVEADG